MNGWNFTISVINVGTLTHCNNSLDFVKLNISESVISVRPFLSYNGPRLWHLCYTDSFLFFPSIMDPIDRSMLVKEKMFSD